MLRIERHSLSKNRKIEKSKKTGRWCCGVGVRVCLLLVVVCVSVCVVSVKALKVSCKTPTEN
jgi:hypothetical protein